MSNPYRYGFGVKVAFGFDLVIEKIELFLDRRGFKVTTRLRMDDVLNYQLTASFGRYIILGVCNPEFARALFDADPNIGLLMPCNLIVYELENGGCQVMVKDPARIMDLMDDPVAIEAAIKIKEELEGVVEELDKL